VTTSVPTFDRRRPALFGAAGLACLVGGGVLFRLGRREVGLGLLAGWVVALLLTVVFLGVVVR
jgi:hypothetical protein